MPQLNASKAEGSVGSEGRSLDSGTRVSFSPGRAENEILRIRSVRLTEEWLQGVEEKRLWPRACKHQCSPSVVADEGGCSKRRRAVEDVWFTRECVVREGLVEELPIPMVVSGDEDRKSDGPWSLYDDALLADFLRWGEEEVEQVEQVGGDRGFGMVE